MLSVSYNVKKKKVKEMKREKKNTDEQSRKINIYRITERIKNKSKRRKKR